MISDALFNSICSSLATTTTTTTIANEPADWEIVFVVVGGGLVQHLTTCSDESCR